MIYKIVKINGEGRSFAVDLSHPITQIGGADPFSLFLLNTITVRCLFDQHFFRAKLMETSFCIETHYWGHLMSTCHGEPGDWIIIDTVARDINLCFAANFEVNYTQI